jgi:hypothetical protein
LESTRTAPRLPTLAVPTVAECPEAVVGGVAAAVAPLPPPPHAATPSEMIGTAAALAMNRIDRMRIMGAPLVDVLRPGRVRRSGRVLHPAWVVIGHDCTVARLGRRRNGYPPEIAPSGTPGRRSGKPYPRDRVLAEPDCGGSPGTTRVSRGVGLSLPPRSGPLEGRLGKRGLARPARESNAPFRARKSR